MDTGKVNEFVGMPKMARLSREIIITEKIDGTNGQIFIAPECAPITLESGRVVPFLVGSRTRWIFPESDNHGFAKWAYENEQGLLALGPGRHFGEWWGPGIQRGYGLREKRFSLFNVVRWGQPEPGRVFHTVPVLYRGMFTTDAVGTALDILREAGSLASPGFMRPEGVVVYHVAGNVGFKKTLENDELPKSLVKEFSYEV
jgi:hypothetical protein